MTVVFLLIQAASGLVLTLMLIAASLAFVFPGLQAHLAWWVVTGLVSVPVYLWASRKAARPARSGTSGWQGRRLVVPAASWHHALWCIGLSGVALLLAACAGSALAAWWRAQPYATTSQPSSPGLLLLLMAGALLMAWCAWAAMAGWRRRRAAGHALLLDHQGVHHPDLAPIPWLDIQSLELRPEHAHRTTDSDHDPDLVLILKPAASAPVRRVPRWLPSLPGPSLRTSEVRIPIAWMKVHPSVLFDAAWHLWTAAHEGPATPPSMRRP